MAQIVFWVVPFYLLFWGQSQHPVVNIVIIIVCFIYFFLPLYFLNRKNSFEHLTENNYIKKNIPGIVFVFLSIIGIVMTGCTCFAALSSLLSDYGYISFEPPLGKDRIGGIMNIYLWHFLNVIPQLKINETFEWKLPFKHNGYVMNVLILLFNVIMIWMVIKVFFKWNTWRKEPIKTEESNSSTTENVFERI